MIIDFVYNLRNAPITFDFAFFLSIACCEANRIGATGARLWIIEGEFRSRTIRDQQMPISEKRWRVDHIILPIARRCSFIRDVVITNGFSGPDKSPRVFPRGGGDDPNVPIAAGYLNQYWAIGISPIIFEPSEEAVLRVRRRFSELLDNQKMACLTIRQSRYFEHRNTDLNEINGICDYLDSKGFGVVVIPDSDNACIAGVTRNATVWSEGATNLDLRLALAQAAYVNIGPSNGPVAMLFLTRDVRVLQYDLLKSDHTGLGVLEGWEKTLGFPVPGNYPWAENGSALKWVDLTAKNVIPDIEKLCEKDH